MLGTSIFKLHNKHIYYNNFQLLKTNTAYLSTFWKKYQCIHVWGNSFRITWKKIFNKSPDFFPRFSNRLLKNTTLNTQKKLKHGLSLGKLTTIFLHCLSSLHYLTCCDCDRHNVFRSDLARGPKHRSSCSLNKQCRNIVVSIPEDDPIGMKCASESKDDRITGKITKVKL